MQAQAEQDMADRPDDRLLTQLRTWDDETLDLLRYYVSSRAWQEHGHSEHLVYDNVVARLDDWDAEIPGDDRLHTPPLPVRDLRALWKFGEPWAPPEWDERD